MVVAVRDRNQIGLVLNQTANQEGKRNEEMKPDQTEQKLSRHIFYRVHIKKKTRQTPDQGKYSNCDRWWRCCQTVTLLLYTMVSDAESMNIHNYECLNFAAHQTKYVHNAKRTFIIL